MAFETDSDLVGKYFDQMHHLRHSKRVFKVVTLELGAANFSNVEVIREVRVLEPVHVQLDGLWLLLCNIDFFLVQLEHFCDGCVALDIDFLAQLKTEVGALVLVLLYNFVDVGEDLLDDC